MYKLNNHTCIVFEESINRICADFLKTIFSIPELLGLNLFTLSCANYRKEGLIKISDHLHQRFPNGVSGGTTRCLAKLKKIFKLRLMMIINN
jgi:hypothetical protein